jgi:RNA-binding protein
MACVRLTNIDVATRGPDPPFSTFDRSQVRMSLSGKQRRHLRALGHHLDPLVQLGKNGLTDGIVSAVDEALETHELVKIRIGTECPDDRHDVAEKLPPLVRAELGQVLGRTLLLYRRHPKEPKISLPKA